MQKKGFELVKCDAICGIVQKKGFDLVKCDAFCDIVQRKRSHSIHVVTKNAESFADNIAFARLFDQNRAFRMQNVANTGVFDHKERQGFPRKGQSGKYPDGR